MRRDLPDGHGKIPKHPTAVPSPNRRVRVRENAAFNLTCGHRIFENALTLLAPAELSFTPFDFGTQ